MSVGWGLYHAERRERCRECEIKWKGGRIVGLSGGEWMMRVQRWSRFREFGPVRWQSDSGDGPSSIFRVLSQRSGVLSQGSRGSDGPFLFENVWNYWRKYCQCMVTRGSRGVSLATRGHHSRFVTHNNQEVEVLLQLFCIVSVLLCFALYAVTLILLFSACCHLVCTMSCMLSSGLLR